jgi:hypothetical protein
MSQEEQGRREPGLKAPNSGEEVMVPKRITHSNKTQQVKTMS